MKNRHSLILTITLLLLAFGLRVYHLNGQSLWSDEGLSLYRITQPLPKLLQNTITVDGIDTRDTTPPFYFLLLRGWYLLTGETVFALRYGGVLLALLAVPLIYQLGRAIGGQQVGLTAALLLAVSPFHIWQSQVLRNYGLLVTLNLLGTYALWRIFQEAKRPWAWLALWVVATLLGIYTHYFGFFFLAYSLVMLTIWVAQAWGGTQLATLLRQRWLWLALLLIALLLVPAVQIGLDRFQAGQQVDFYYIPPSVVARHALSAFAVGMSPSLSHPWNYIWPSLALAIVGLGMATWPRPITAVFLLGYQLIPLGVLQLLSLLNPLYNGTRHLLIGLPPFLLLIALGLGQKRPRWVQLPLWAVGMAVMAIQLNWLHAQFTAPQLVRDDVRGAAEYLNQHATADDVIILHDTLIGFTFDYYYDGAAPWQAVPLYANQDAAVAIAELEAIAAQANGRIWFLTEPTPRTAFPPTALPEWVSEHWQLLWARQFPHMWLPVRLEMYLPQPNDTAVPPTTTQTHTFGNALDFHGHNLPPTAEAGQAWWLTSYWSAQNTVAGQYNLALRWENSGIVWAQIDQLLWPTYSPAAWPEDNITRFDQELTLPASLPTGKYTVWLRIIDPAGTTLLAENGEADVYLGEMDIAPTTADLETALATLPPYTPDSARFGALNLIGHRLSAGDLRPGHLLSIEFIWQARRTPRYGYHLRVQFISETGELLLERTTPLAPDNYPVHHWPKGALVQGLTFITIPATAEPTNAYVEITVLDGDSSPVADPLRLPELLRLNPWPMLTEPPDMDTAVNALWGDEITLLGYDVTQTAEQLMLNLVWRAEKVPSTNYYVFIHVTDPATGEIVRQRDWFPADGIRPTEGWRPTEIILDPHTLDLTGLPAGNYRLTVGLYNPQDFTRPVVTLGGAEQPDRQLLLQELTIE